MTFSGPVSEELHKLLRDIEIPETFRVQKFEPMTWTYLNPQEVFDALPLETRERIELDDFKAVLTTSLLFFVEIAKREADLHTVNHITAILKVEKV